MPWRHAIEKLDGREAVLCDCWIWWGMTDEKGIPVRRTKDGHTTAARAEWEKRVGPIPNGKYLLAVCGRRLCVNPHHRDLVSHREQAFRCGITKLTPGVAETAWQCAQAGMSHRRIAKVFGVSPRTAGRIAKREYPMFDSEERDGNDEL